MIDNMTQEEKSLIIALIIGDGHIDNTGRISINHCEKQKEYLQFKADLIYGIIGGKPITLHKTKAYINGKEYHGYSIRKCCKKKLIQFRQLMYPNGRKEITREILEQLTPQGIAIWYMDDGSLTPERDKSGNIKAYKLGIATYLSKEENQVIIDYFKEKWNLEFHSHKDGSQYRLRMGTKEARKFLQLVRPYVNIECMKYKVIEI